MTTAAFTPDLIGTDGTVAEDLQSKCKMLQGVHFPKPPEADLTELDGYVYPRPKGDWVPVTEWEVSEAIRNSPPDKAPGDDQLPNRVLKAAATIITPSLTHLFNASLQLQHVPEHFKKSISVILRKPGKSDYSGPKAYRPIALMNTMGKILDSVLAKRISYLAEKYSMLPITHAGGRKLLSVEHGIHGILERVHSSWRKEHVTSLLLLDVSGAFDNVSHERLLHNMRKRGLPLQLIGWIAHYLKGRRTKIKLAEGLGPEFVVDTGIPQGSPLSPILYLFYNADLLEIKGIVTSRKAKVGRNGFIDDIAISTEGATTRHTTHRLKPLIAECQDWAKKHASVFAPDKFELVHFVHKKNVKTVGDLTIGVEIPASREGESPITITPSPQARYIGVILDTHLTCGPHLKHIQERANTSIAALQAISGSTWGVTRNDMLKLYKAINCTSSDHFRQLGLVYPRGLSW